MTRRRFGRVATALCGAIAVAQVLANPVHAAAAGFTKQTRTFDVLVGPNDDHPCSVLGDLYIPRSASARHPVPAILTTNGFGGSKDDQAGLAAYGASHGYEVLSYSGLGFGGSGCNIELDDPDWDGKAASQLISFLGRRPEVIKDGPDDPRVGMIGGSYGGGVQFATAAVDRRLDTIVPIITWNDLSYSLTPNNDSPAFTYSSSPPGVPKLDWTELFFADGLTEPLQHASTTPKPTSTCPGFDPRVCPSNLESGALGYPDRATTDLLRHASAASFMDRIRIPTLLMQGEADTLFTIAEAVANYRGIKANGAPVKLVLQSWGHSNSDAAPGEFSESQPASSYEGQLVLRWFERYLRHRDVDTGPEVEYFRDWVAYDSHGTAAPAYGHANSWPVGRAVRMYLDGNGALVRSAAGVVGGTAAIVNPANGTPASYSETSGVQTMAPFRAIPPSDPPGEVASWSTPPLVTDTDVVGVPSVDVTVGSVLPAGVDPALDPVLFAKLYDVAPDGTVDLVQRLVSPVRVGDTSLAAHINLPGIVHRYRKGHRIRLALATTDLAYVTSRVANVVLIHTDAAHPGVLTLPVVGKG
jgi:ABC-2 type transport system ATP-binding protein